MLKEKGGGMMRRRMNVLKERKFIVFIILLLSIVCIYFVFKFVKILSSSLPREDRRLIRQENSLLIEGVRVLPVLPKVNKEFTLEVSYVLNHDFKNNPVELVLIFPDDFTVIKPAKYISGYNVFGEPDKDVKPDKAITVVLNGHKGIGKSNFSVVFKSNKAGAKSIGALLWGIVQIEMKKGEYNIWYDKDKFKIFFPVENY